MGNYKKIIINILISILISLFNHLSCQGQINEYSTTYSLEQVDSIIHQLDSIILSQLEKDINYFIKTGEAYILLSDPNYYKILPNYSQTIRDKLFECYKGCSGSHYNRKVLGLLDLPQYMKDSLLNFKYTELEVRAGLGDTLVQQEVIRQYREFLKRDNKTSDEIYEYLFKNKLPLILLIYIGTEESIKTFINGMNTLDIYENTNGSKNKESVFYDLLSSYSGLLGEVPITSYFYYDRFLYVENESELGEEYGNYLQQLEQYFYKRHGVEVTIQAPYLILGSEYYIEH